MDTQVLVMPGIHGSGPKHWQTLWETQDPDYRRIQVDDWDHPHCASWVAAIDEAVASAPAPVLLVAHSLGCLATVTWAMQAERTDKLRGLLLVSVPDPLGPNFPADAKGFSRPALQLLPTPGIVVSSENDPYGAPAYMRTCADAWGCRFVNAGLLGHINAASDVGDWPMGRALLDSLR
ncbi:RBBP9/YdeN family alpha/beta hydrolase [Herbaspirillum sp. GCM10030257]|uniref:RBBP9/YdeN family alpha/beta hydrolase n=1 Tax=Herbaspirillum sp. GCM10030257 TaxID=3273393 RepID=UPI00361668AA